MSWVPFGDWKLGSGRPALGTAPSGKQAVGVIDAVELFQGLEHRVEMRRVGELELEAHAAHPVRRRVRRRGDDAHMVLGEHLGNVGQQPVAVERLHLDGGDEDAAAVLVPLHLDQALLVVGREGDGVRAVLAVNRDATAAGDEPITRSPGTGVQQRERRTITSSSPST